MENPIARAAIEARKVEAGEAPGAAEFFKEKGVEDTQMTPTQLQDAGWSYIYHAKTGIPSLVNNNWLTKKLGHLDKGGAYIWSATQTVIPKKGTHKCMLHPEQASREEFDELGFNTCLKSNLTSLFQVRRHAMKRHKDEWAAIEQMRTDAEKAEDRAAQRTMMEAIASSKPAEVVETPQVVGVEEKIGTSEAPLYVSAKDRDK